MVKRIARGVKKSSRRLQWTNFDMDVILAEPCCKKYCLKKVNEAFLKDRIIYFRSLPRHKRLHALTSMNSSSGDFIFDGIKVCSKFLTKAFRFSPDVQSKVKRLPDSVTSQFSDDIHQACSTSSSYRMSVEAETSNLANPVVDDPISTPLQKDTIINFLDRISDDVAEVMPDSSEVHLPLFRKEDVHSLFVRDFSKLYPTLQPPSLSYFYVIWQEYRFNVKVRKRSRFTKCTKCEQLRSAMEAALIKNQPTDDIRSEQMNHLEFVACERREYMKKVELAILRPAKYLSAIIDGADQHDFSLPHFVTKIKEARGNGMRTHLIGALRHSSNKALRLYTMSDDHATGSNHIVETVHRFIQDVAARGYVPKHFFLQLDNCVRENKNKYLMAYLDALVKWEVFDAVEIGFLPVGHTHSDIDQCFSTTSDRLKYHNAVTLDDLHEQLKKCYNERTTVERMTKVVNWSQLCDQSKCINNISNITQYRFFKIMLSDAETKSTCQNRQTVCHVRNVCTEDWHTLESDSGKGVKSFLKFLPDILQTPPEILKAPDDEKDVRLYIDSQRSRMDRHQTKSVLDLKSTIYKNKSVPFHWDLRNSVEFQDGKLPRPSSSTVQLTEGDSNNITNENDNNLEDMDYDYDVGSIVVVNTGKENLSDTFWIARIADKHEDNTGSATKLTVLWHEFYNMAGRNIFNAMFRPCLLLNENQTVRDVPWFSQIDTKTVMVTFKHWFRPKSIFIKIGLVKTSCNLYMI